MRVTVNADRCRGSANCVGIAPEVCPTMVIEIGN